jgi:hypothetical protein
MTDHSDQRDRASKERGGPGTPIGLRLAIVWAVTATTLAALTVGRNLPVPRGDDRSVVFADWGWAGVSMPAQHASRDDYLDRLAEASEEWYRVEREDPLSLARRMSELRQGCSILLLSVHRPLTLEDRTWLMDSCRSWSARCDGYLIALESGTEPRIIRGQVDRLIEEIATALRKQARSTPDGVRSEDQPQAL